MNRAYRWHSPRLGRDMGLLVFGHAGARVLVFPTRDGRFWEYATIGLIDSLAPKLRAGQRQLFCVDGLHAESLGNPHGPPERGCCARRRSRIMLHEVLPLLAVRNPHPRTVAHGCSLGAWRAVIIAFRPPPLFARVAAFSGRYGLPLAAEHFADRFDPHDDDAVCCSTPAHFLPGLDCGWRLGHLRRMQVVRAVATPAPSSATTGIWAGRWRRRASRMTCMSGPAGRIRAAPGGRWRRSPSEPSQAQAELPGGRGRR